MIRGLLLVEVMRPKSPGLMICPVFESMLPPDEAKALRLLIGFAKFTRLKRLKNSARNSMLFDSPTGKRLMMEKSTLTCFGPRSTLRPTLPKSVPVTPAGAVPFELGISWPASTIGRANEDGLKKYPDGTLLVAVERVAPGAQLGRDSPLFSPK